MGCSAVGPCIGLATQLLEGPAGSGAGMISEKEKVGKTNGERAMLNGKKIFVVMPAYNAVRTLRQTCAELPRETVDEILLVDDHSSDATVELARELRLTTFVHHRNMGYGRNQKTCYREALRRGADIIVMLHADYQYSPRLVTAMASMIAFGEYDLVLGSRILGLGAVRGGMPRYKYISNRFLTFFQNVIFDR